jgi:hypothetical protein
MAASLRFISETAALGVSFQTISRLPCRVITRDGHGLLGKKEPGLAREPGFFQRSTERPTGRPGQQVRAGLCLVLQDKRRQLASETVSRVLARGGHDDVATFLEAIRAADLAAFRRLLQEAFARELAAHPEKKTIRLTLRQGSARRQI